VKIVRGIMFVMIHWWGNIYWQHQKSTGLYFNFLCCISNWISTKNNFARLVF